MTQAAALNETLEFGLFDWIEWDKSAPHDIFENRLKMLEYADRSGFYSYHLAEHHITPLSVSALAFCVLGRRCAAHIALASGPAGLPASLLQSDPPVPRDLYAGQPQQRPPLTWVWGGESHR